MQKLGNNRLKDVSLDIEKNGLNKDNLQKIEDYAKQITKGKARYTRF